MYYMKHLFIVLLPLYNAFHLRSTPTHSRLSLTKNTPYGPLEYTPFSDVYKGLEKDSIKGIYFSEDLKDIYVVENPEKVPTKLPILIHF